MRPFLALLLAGAVAGGGAFLMGGRAPAVQRRSARHRPPTSGVGGTSVPPLPDLTDLMGLAARPTSARTMLPDASLLLAETEAWVGPTAAALDLLTNFYSLAMLTRVVLGWYPQTDTTQLPWLLVVAPTEPLLRAARGTVPPAFGVDITPIVWLGLFTFLHEILLGPQGLLTLKMKYGI